MFLFQYSWFTLTLASVFLWALTTIIQKIGLKGKEVYPSSFGAYFQILAGLSFVPVAISGFKTFPHSTGLWLLIGLLVLLYFSANLMYFYGLKAIDVSEVSIIESTRAIWFMLGGLIFFQEMITFNKFFGTILIFLGLVIIYWGKGGFSRLGINHLLILGYAVLFSLANILSKYILVSVQPAALQTITFITPAILNMIFIRGTVTNMRPLLKFNKYNLYVILSAVACALGSLTLYTAYKFAEISKIGPISQTSIILTVILGIFVLNEKDNLSKKILAAVIAFAGVVLIKF